MMHVDDFIDDILLRDSDADVEPKRYAQFFFLLARLPAWQQMSFRPFTQQFKLFCTFEGHRYRVTGASRLGDVWLHSDFSRDHGYQKRVDVAKCADWSPTP